MSNIAFDGHTATAYTLTKEDNHMEAYKALLKSLEDLQKAGLHPQDVRLYLISKEYDGLLEALEEGKGGIVGKQETEYGEGKKPQRTLTFPTAHGMLTVVEHA